MGVVEAQAWDVHAQKNHEERFCLRASLEHEEASLNWVQIKNHSRILIDKKKKKKKHFQSTFDENNFGSPIYLNGLTKIFLWC